MFNLAAQWQLQLPNLDNIVPQIPSIPCTPHEQLWQNRNITSLRRVPNPLTVISMCWIPADNSDTAIRGITAGWNALRVAGSNPHPLAHAHAFTCCDSSGWGFRWRFCRFHNSKVVRLCLATLHSTRELWFCWELTSAFYQDMRNNQDIHDTNSPANDLDSSKQPEGSRKQHSLSYCGTMVSQKYPQSCHTSPCRPTYLGALLLISGNTTPKGRTHQPDKQLWVQTSHNCHTTPSNHATTHLFQ